MKILFWFCTCYLLCFISQFAQKPSRKENVIWGVDPNILQYQFTYLFPFIPYSLDPISLGLSPSLTLLLSKSLMHFTVQNTWFILIHNLSQCLCCIEHSCLLPTSLKHYLTLWKPHLPDFFSPHEILFLNTHCWFFFSTLRLWLLLFI